MVTMLDVLNDPAHAALVGWIVSVAVSIALLIVGLIGWMEIQNRKDHRDLGHRIDKLNNRADQVNTDLGHRIDKLNETLAARIDDLYKLLLERLPPPPAGGDERSGAANGPTGG